MTADRSLPVLVRRARAGEAKAEDATEAAKQLMANPNDDDRYDLLFVIGKADAVQYRTLVEGYLESPDNPMLARLALQILCDWWGPAQPYRDQLVRFIRGVDWDLRDGSFVRLVASSAAGEYLRGDRDPEMLRALVELYSNEGAPDLDRGQAYAAILRALGKGWNEIPRAHKADWHLRVDPSLLAEARRLSN